MPKITVSLSLFRIIVDDLIENFPLNDVIALNAINASNDDFVG